MNSTTYTIETNYAGNTEWRTGGLVYDTLEAALKQKTNMLKNQGWHDKELRIVEIKRKVVL